MNKVFVGVLVAVGAGIVVYFVASRAEQRPEETMPVAVEGEQAPQPNRYHVPVTEDQPSVGPQDALVTIVEFSDFQCVYCARMVGTLNELRDRFGDDLRIVWRNMPTDMHPHSEIASRLAMEAYAQDGDEGFWKMHDALFQSIEERLDDEKLREIAKELGFDPTSVLEGNAQAAVVHDDVKLGVKLGLPGTPVYFVNGVQVQGAIPRPMFRAIVEQELETAKALVENGVQKDAVYAELIKDAEKEAPELPREVTAPDLEYQSR